MGTAYSGGRKKPPTGELYSHQLEERARDALQKGYLTNALYLYREVAARNPRNARAWRALLSLEEDVERRLQACQRLLELEPFDVEVHETLEALRLQQRRVYEQKARWAAQQVERARLLLEEQRRKAARETLKTVVKTFADNAEAWRLLAGLTTDLDERVRALEEAVRCAPRDARLRGLLERWRYLREHPLELAAAYEAEGRWEQALLIYQQQTAQAHSPEEWKRIHRRIARLERLRNAGARRASPAVRFIRLSLGPILLYLALVWVQAGLDVRSVSPAAWLGMLSVTLGALLLGTAAARARGGMRHTLSSGRGTASALVRSTAAFAGWVLILVPFLLSLWDAMNRLRAGG